MSKHVENTTESKKTKKKWLLYSRTVNPSLRLFF